MNWIVSIFRMANSNWTSRIFTLVLILLGTYSATTIFKAKATTVKADCTPYQEQVKILSQTLEQVSKAVDALAGAKTTSFTGMEAGLSFAYYRDTTAIPLLSLCCDIGGPITNGTYIPAWYWDGLDTLKKPLTQSQQQVILKDLKKKLDSAKWKVDSINKQQKSKT